MVHQVNIKKGKKRKRSEVFVLGGSGLATQRARKKKKRKEKCFCRMGLGRDEGGWGGELTNLGGKRRRSPAPSYFGKKITL